MFVALRAVILHVNGYGGIRLPASGPILHPLRPQLPPSRPPGVTMPPMAVPKRLHDAKGLWKGKSQLNLPWLAPDKRVTESNSQLHIDTDAHDAFATIAYTWEHEGKRQEGTMLVAMAKKSKAVEIGWCDSWHQPTGVLHLTGTEAESGSLKTKGSYAAGNENWGWTIAFDFDGDQLKLTMENVTPAGEAEWAVKAVYKKD